MKINKYYINFLDKLRELFRVHSPSRMYMGVDEYKRKK